MHGYTFDQCWKTIPDEHGHTASSDRGWIYLDDVCYGHYLDYGPNHYDCETHSYSNGPFVHAVVFDRDTHNNNSYCTFNRRWKVFTSVLEAQEWMITEKTGQLSLYVQSGE